MKLPVKLSLVVGVGFIVPLVVVFYYLNDKQIIKAPLQEVAQIGLKVDDLVDLNMERADDWAEENIGLVQRLRQARVEEVCKNIDNKNVTVQSEMFRHLFVDDVNRFIYCEVPKVACTNWKRIMLIMTGKVNTTDPEALPAGEVHGTLQDKYLRTLNTYSSEDIQSRLKNYYKFMFVRNPIERLFSAYKNKFAEKYSTYFQFTFGRKIVRQYRKNATQTSLQKGNDVTFKEFLTYLLDPARKRTPLNPHWRHFYQLCRPCLINYNFIGKYDSLSEDVTQVLADLQVDKSIRFPESPKVARRPKIIDLLNAGFADITADELHRLWEMYSVDFALYGYNYPGLNTHY